MGLARTKTIGTRVMPAGFTETEAFAEADYRASRGDFTPVDIDHTVRTVEKEVPTLYGRIVNALGKIAGHGDQERNQ